MLLHSLAGLVGAASYYPGPPPDNAGWDTLYTAASTVGMILIIVLAASFMNARESRRDN